MSNSIKRGVKPIETVGIIGAGIAGLTCARKLRSAGIAVTLLEKSRGVGGRLATRRLDSGLTFDHGAQYFTVRDTSFAAQVKEWCLAGTAQIWQGRIISLDHGVLTELNHPQDRYVGVPSMNAIAKSLATGLDVRTSITVQRLSRLNDQWQLTDTEGIRHGPFDMLISTAPPPQTLTLLGAESALLSQQLAQVSMAPCWAVMLELPEPLPAPFAAAFVQNSPLSWVAHNSSKPERNDTACWVLHASPTWSREHLEDSAESVTQTLVEEFWQAAGQSPVSIRTAIAHRWRYAIPDEPLPQKYLLDQEKNLAACGDWCGGPRVEGAYLSGLALANKLI
ncbi:MAG: FAD-dependent oxidoreductase [Bythopirellula sp.]|nr:FAD-dependent oxidoreductase [Bythopirellula sp.]